MSKTGFCSICKQPKVKVINDAIKAAASFTAALEIAEDNGFRFAKATFYSHKEHVTSPLLTDAEKARANPVVQPRSNKAVLEAIRDLGMAKAIADPDSVTVNQALRAAAILAEKESKTEGILVVLAKALQGAPAQEVIEGSFTEMPMLETQEVVTSGHND